ncbi:NAD(P)H-binding protein [Kineosporia mesophila]|uniref:NAD(P)H-binding protein n=1 Tax=Kineosporia mesophila TaxID=566012 RepID=A0ABP6Z9B6_9ACTN|nr:NAD(P)H-binding protein [Kineosporia mesophila]MCD5352017.1 NAD(P)H-binding protein [Kineosporia mesophila]
MTYLIIGATGNVGGALVSDLHRQGHSVRALVRDPQRARHLPVDVDLVVGDLDDTEALTKAVQGVEGVFYMQAHPSIEQAGKYVEIAGTAGVSRTVLLSSFGTVAYPRPIIGEMIAARDEVFRTSSPAVTYLKANTLMTNALWWVPTIRAEGRVYDATDPGKTVPIDTVDVARVAAVALTQDGHAGRSYILNGPDALSSREQVDILNETLGLDIELVHLTPAQLAEKNIASGMPERAARGLENLHTLFATGRSSVYAEDALWLTGRPLTTFGAWCERNAASFR